MKIVVVALALVALVLAAPEQYEEQSRATSNTDGGTSQSGQSNQVAPTQNNAFGVLLGLAGLLSLLLGNLNVNAPVQAPVQANVASQGGSTGAGMGSGAGGLHGTGASGPGTSNTNGGVSQTGQSQQTAPTLNNAFGGLVGLAGLINILLGTLNLNIPVQAPAQVNVASQGGSTGAAMGSGAGGLQGTGTRNPSTGSGTTNSDGGVSQSGQSHQNAPTVNNAIGGLVGATDLVTLLLGNLNAFIPIQAPIGANVLSAGGQQGAAIGPGAGGLTGTQSGGGSILPTGTSGGSILPTGTSGGSGLGGLGGLLGGLTGILGPLIGLLGLIGLSGGGGGGIRGRIATPEVVRCSSQVEQDFRTGREAFHGEPGFTFPGHTTEFEVETPEGKSKVIQSTYGHQIGDSMVVHSVLIGNSSALREFVGDKLTTDSSADHPEAIDVTLAEFNLKSLTSLAINMIMSKSTSDQMPLVADCQSMAMECFLESRMELVMAKDCSELLNECFSRKPVAAVPLDAAV